MTERYLPVTEAEPQQGTPEWWLARLTPVLDERARTDWRRGRLSARVLDDYYRGRHPLLFASDQFRQAWGGLFDRWADNFTKLVVDAVKERMKVQGFRMGRAAEHGDDDAWRIWQRNYMDADYPRVLLEALKKRESAFIVSPFRNEWPEPDVPLITGEDPLEVVVVTHRQNRRRRLAALKRFVDDDGRIRAALYSERAVYWWRSRQDASQFSASGMEWGWVVRPQDWERVEIDGVWPLEHDLAVVPVIPHPNQADLRGTGEAEHESILPVQDAINKLVADMLVNSEYTAYPQRYAVNLEQPVDANGNPVPLVMGTNRMLTIGPPEDPNMPEVRFGEFKVGSAAPYIEAVEALINHAASITHTPSHYLLAPKGQALSGESMRAHETSLISKVADRMVDSGEVCEEVIRTCFLALGDERSRIFDSETIWADHEYRTESEHVDAVLKKMAAGVPQEQIWEELGYSPTQIARFKRSIARQNLQAVLTPVAPMPVALPDMARRALTETTDARAA